MVDNTVLAVKYIPLPPCVFRKYGLPAPTASNRTDQTAADGWIGKYFADRSDPGTSFLRKIGDAIDDIEVEEDGWKISVDIDKFNKKMNLTEVIQDQNTVLSVEEETRKREERVEELKQKFLKDQEERREALKLKFIKAKVDRFRRKMNRIKLERDSSFSAEA